MERVARVSVLGEAQDVRYRIELPNVSKHHGIALPVAAPCAPCADDDPVRLHRVPYRMKYVFVIALPDGTGVPEQCARVRSPQPEQVHDLKYPVSPPCRISHATAEGRVIRAPVGSRRIEHDEQAFRYLELREHPIQ